MEMVEDIEDAIRCEQCGNLTKDGHFKKDLSRCCSACGKVFDQMRKWFAKTKASGQVMDVLEGKLQEIAMLPDTVYLKCEATPSTTGNRLSKVTFKNISLTTLLKDLKTNSIASLGRNAPSTRNPNFLASFLLAQTEYKEG